MEGSIRDWQPTGVRLVLLRYGAAFLWVLAGLLIAWLLEAVLDPSVLLLVSVLMAAWFGGVGPALLASLLATFADDYYFTVPLHTIEIEWSHLPHVAVFALAAVFFATISAARRKAERELKAARDGMEAKVRQRTAELQQSNEALEELAGRLIHAQEEERSRIGRELHDHISQTLGVLTIKVDQLRIHDEITPAVGAALDDLRKDTTEITEDVHRLSHRLHSSTLDYLGLLPALEKLVSEFSERHDIRVTFAHASMPALPSEVALCLFRVAEESLTNIAKHSKARSAQVHVAGEPDGIHLTVEDAGTGFDVARLESRGGLGFVSMRERLRVLHGTVRIDSTPARGTRIDVWVPAAASLQ